MNIATARLDVKIKADPHVYRPDIDGLRTVAVLLVVFFHAWPNWLKSGFIGVDIFFVISGFLITSIIIEDVARNRFTIREFYIRRVRRIFPALILVVGLTLLAGWVLMMQDEFQQLGKHTASGATFIANLILWSEAGYFDNDSSTKPLLHLWSLGVEEQFYIVWPVIVWAVYRYKLGFLKFTAVIFVASFSYSLYATYNAPTEGYFSPLTRFWELLAGGMCAHALRHHSDCIARYSAVLGWAGFTIFLTAVIFVTEQTPFPGWWALAPVIGTCALLLAGERSWINGELLSHPIAVRIGLVSYPFYLWHWPLLSFGFILNGEKPSALLKAALVAAALMLAVLTYKLFELPLKRIVRKRLLITSLCAGMVALGVSGVIAASGMISPRVDSNSANHIVSALNDFDFPTTQMTPYSFQGVTFQQVRGSGQGITVFLGDSVMEQYGSYVSNKLLEVAYQRRAVIFATAGGCPPIKGAVRLPRMKFPTCQKTVDTGHALALTPEVDTVVIGAAWYGYFADDFVDLEIDGLAFPASTAQDRAYSSLQESIGNFVQNGKRVYVVLAPPAGAEFDPRSMIEGSRLSGKIIVRRNIQAFNGRVFRQRNQNTIDRLTRIATESGAVVIDPMDFLCEQILCRVLDVNGDPIYTDSVHIRPQASLKVADYLAPSLRPPSVASRR